jgi:hypothetical protein
MQVAAPKEEAELLLGEGGIDHGERDRMEGEIPRREPGILPRVGHRDDVLGDQVPPLVVAQPAVAGEWIGAVLGQPPFHVQRVVLLGPEHAGERLPADGAFLVGEVTGEHLGPVPVGLLAPCGHHLREVGERVGELAVGKPDLDRGAAAGRYRHDVV